MGEIDLIVVACGIGIGWLLNDIWRDIWLRIRSSTH